MTPFDAVALLAMLLAFYPIVGPAALVRARSERPEYFAGGTLIGHSGDAMRLPDGRVFDLIFAVSTPQQRWQVLDVTNPGTDSPTDDPFALQDGPLVPFDLSELAPAVAGSVRASLDGAVVGQTRDLDQALGLVAESIVSGLAAAPGADGNDVDMDIAFQAYARGGGQLQFADPTDVIERAFGHGALIDASQSDYVEPPPPDIPVRGPRLDPSPDDPKRPRPQDTPATGGEPPPPPPLPPGEPAPEPPIVEPEPPTRPEPQVETGGVVEPEAPPPAPGPPSTGTGGVEPRTPREV